jgi:hypothetical protein
MHQRSSDQMKITMKIAMQPESYARISIVGSFVGMASDLTFRSMEFASWLARPFRRLAVRHCPTPKTIAPETPLREIIGEFNNCIMRSNKTKPLVAAPAASATKPAAADCWLMLARALSSHAGM